MFEARDFCDRPTVYSRAEPDDEYDRRPDPFDPNLIEQEDWRRKSELDEEEEFEDDDEP